MVFNPLIMYNPRNIEGLKQQWKTEDPINIESSVFQAQSNIHDGKVEQVLSTIQEKFHIEVK